MLEQIPAVICLACTGVLVWAEVNENASVRIVSKTLAATSFIAYAIAMGAASAGSPGLWVIAALALSMVGDLCLLSREKKFFLAGIGAFLLGHVAYVGAFASLGVDFLGTALAAVGVGVLAFFVWRWLSPHTGDLTRAVAAYILVISSMVAMATGSVFLEASPGRIGLLVAAIGFFCSDLCVARDRFVAPGPSNRMVGLPLYFGSQLVFAGTIAMAT